MTFAGDTELGFSLVLTTSASVQVGFGAVSDMVTVRTSSAYGRRNGRSTDARARRRLWLGDGGRPIFRFFLAQSGARRRSI